MGLTAIRTTSARRTSSALSAHVLHAEPLGQARRPSRAAIGHEDALAERRIGAQPALDHGAGHVAGADRAQVVVSFTRRMVLAAASPERSGAALRLRRCPRRPPPGAVLRRVRLELRGDLRDMVVCHCVECRRYHGTAAAYTAVDRAGLAIDDPEGAAALVPRPAERDGRRARLLQPLRLEPALARAGGDDLSVAAGTLEGPTGLRIGAPHLGRAACRLGARRRPPALAAGLDLPRRRGLDERAKERRTGRLVRLLGVPQDGHAERQRRDPRWPPRCRRAHGPTRPGPPPPRRCPGGGASGCRRPRRRARRP